MGSVRTETADDDDRSLSPPTLHYSAFGARRQDNPRQSGQRLTCTVAVSWRDKRTLQSYVPNESSHFGKSLSGRRRRRRRSFLVKVFIYIPHSITSSLTMRVTRCQPKRRRIRSRSRPACPPRMACVDASSRQLFMNHVFTLD